MGKSTNGPEWTDLTAMMSALETCHTCRVECRVTPAGQGHNGSVKLVVCATFTVLPGSDLPKEILVDAVWPSGKARTFEGLVYNLLWQLDYAIGQGYEQMTLKNT